MRAEVEFVRAVPAAFAEHEGVGQCSGAGGDMHGGAAGEIEPAHHCHPAGGIPGPAGDGVVDESGPEEHEDDAGKHAAAFGDGADGEGDAKGVLVGEWEVVRWGRT